MHKVSQLPIGTLKKLAIKAVAELDKKDGKEADLVMRACIKELARRQKILN